MLLKNEARHIIPNTGQVLVTCLQREYPTVWNSEFFAFSLPVTLLKER